FQKNTLSSLESAPTFVELFEINELKTHAQAKDTVILQLKEKLRSLKDFQATKEQLSKLKGKAVLTEAVSLNPIDPELLKVDVAPLVPKLRKNRTTHIDYIKHTLDEAATLREIVESERLLSPLNTSLDYAYSSCSKHMTGDRSQLINFVQKFLGTVKFGNDHVAMIMGYGDYQIGNVTIYRVYYVKGLGHNLFSIGQFCDSDLEVAFCQHTCFIRNFEGVDLLTGSRGNNLYTLSLQDMMASSPICLLSKASKTKSWLWHHRLSHLNFGTINHLARQGLVRGLPMLKFEKITFVQHVRLNVPVRRILIDNGTEFVNQTLRDYYEEVDISHKTSVARSPQQNGVVERSMDFEQSSSGPALNDMTPRTISSRLVHTSSSSTSFVPPLRNNWDLLFQPMFDELLNPPPSVVNQAAEVIAPIAEVIPQVDANSIGSPSLTTVDQDAPSPSKSLTPTAIQSSVILQDVGNDNMDME
nr:integrase, catalytic region, zinc finger, CCHC-type, peptidase aspartic, catalytic [Tanacetum cinerariifolium]